MTKFLMNEDNAGGFFPDTVGLHLRKQMQEISPPQFDYAEEITLNTDAEFTNGVGDKEADYAFNLKIKDLVNLVMIMTLGQHNIPIHLLIPL